MSVAMLPGGDARYLVLELVPGESLTKRIGDTGALPRPEALAIHPAVVTVVTGWTQKLPR